MRENKYYKLARQKEKNSLPCLFEKKNDLQKLEFLNELNNYVEGVERKYSNA